MDQEAFNQACSLVIDAAREGNGIGTLGEKTVHAVLKQYLSPNPAFHEQKVDGFVADICRPEGIIEIQTRGFDKLRRKLDAFLTHGPVTVVYPIAHTKYLRWIDPLTGQVSAPRKSPLTGKIYSIIPELYKLKFYLNHPNLHFKIILIDVEEYRMLDGWSRDKKKGSTKCDKIPLGLYDEIDLNSPEDYVRFLPDGLPEEFTSSDYQKAARIPQGYATTALHIFHYTGCLERTGKKGKAYLYRKTESKKTQPEV
ncbi:MAG: hypothetical protein J6B85_00480 [Lachnospiraceae bacterium]|nr:hypothetical protein [Lachnospiraceae bacterium]